MGIRAKLLDLKSRLQDRKMYSIVIVIIGVTAIWGLYELKTAASLRQELDNQYNRAFCQLTESANNLETLLLKSLITSTQSGTAYTLQEAWKQANTAQTNLCQLPVEQHILENTSKFLTQLGDLANTLNKKSINGIPLTNEQYKTLEDLYNYAAALNNSLIELNQQIFSGRIKWKELSQKGRSLFQYTSNQMPASPFENVEKAFVDYPTLIYDGPFSEHVTNIEPKGLTGIELSNAELREKIVNFLGSENIKSVEEMEPRNSEPVKVVSFKVKLVKYPNDNILIDVTQKGGHIYWMLMERSIGNATVSVEDARNIGTRFLESRGFKNMTETYFLRDENTITINYAYKQDNVVCYPDLIKVKIALDNGDIIGFEAKGYIFSHEERNLKKPKISMKQAENTINPKVKIKGIKLAVIPTEYKTELLTYEIRCTYNDNLFFVYINTDNGKEEEILQILDTPDGILTM